MPDVDLFAGDDSASIDDGIFDVTTRDYAFAFQQHLPHGEAWNFKPNGVAEKLFLGSSFEYSRVERRGRELIDEMYYPSVQELIDEWEEDAGLPADCEGGTPPTTLEGRQTALHQKLTRRPSGNVPFFLATAASLGYPTAEIVTYGDPFLCTSECTHGLWGFEGYWLTAWTLVANGTTENDATLACLVRDYAKATEIVNVEFP